MEFSSDHQNCFCQSKITDTQNPNLAASESQEVKNEISSSSEPIQHNHNNGSDSVSDSVTVPSTFNKGKVHIVSVHIYILIYVWSYDANLVFERMLSMWIADPSFT